MLLIDNLSVSYSKGHHVLRNMTVQLNSPAIHGIVGMNGSGKTTLFNTIFGLTPHQNGMIRWNGASVSRNSMSYLPTENFFYSGITGREYLELIHSDGFKLSSWNDIFQLPLDQIIDEYSSGMKKQLALLAIIKQDKPVILLDEPFNGLDMEMSYILKLILSRWQIHHKTILISSHIIETLFSVCDYMHYLENGSFLFSAPKDEFSGFETRINSYLEKRHADAIDSLLSDSI